MKISNRYVESLSNERLLESLSLLNIQERETEGTVLLHLIEVEKRELYLELGFSSMFAYLTERLKYPEASAYRRLASARVIKDYPESLDLLIGGAINISSLSLVAKLLTPENKNKIIEAIRDKSTREVEAYVSGYRPVEAKLRERVRPVTIKKEAPPLFGTQVTSGAGSTPETVAQPVIQKRFELKFSVSEEVFAKHKEVQVLLSNKYPKCASLEEAYNELLEVFLNNKSPKRRAERRTKRASKDPQSKGRHIPVSVRDLVFNRDRACCGYVGRDGHRCGSTHELEIDHVKPFALGGSHDPENLRVLCGKHNRYRSGRRGTVPGYGVSMTRRNKFGDSPGAVWEA